MEKKDTLLQSKIQTPATARNYLIRERLICRIEDAEERLIVVSASMGYGKTVLLTHYAKRYPERVAWYHLNETDNDIMVFAHYLSRSVGRIIPGFHVDLSPYMALDQDEGMVHNLAADFAAAFRELDELELTLVLDDFQVIENDWIFQLLQILLDGNSGQLRVILCMKTAPPAFCARYLMEGRALILGADSLAFNLEEIKLLLRSQTSPNTLEAATQAMLKRTEGWPAGISFVLLYFRQWQREMTEQEIDRACQQNYLRDYFVHEMFRKLPFELQQFLTKTSVLDYLRPDVCNLLLGTDNADSQLSYLEQENLFILHLSGDGRIYRYHSLFRNFLQGQLKPGQRKQLLGRAADFYLRTPDKAQAAEYAIACEDGERLLSAMESAGYDMLQRGHLGTLRRWLEALEAFGTPFTPEIMVIQSLYDERVGDWRKAMDQANYVLDLPVEQSGEFCRLKAGLLLAWLKRESGSIPASLKVLEQFIPVVRFGRRQLDTVRWWGVELRQQNLLDLGLYNQALSLILDELEDCVRRRSQQEIFRARELAVICYAAMGEYHQAMQMYVVLRGSGAEGGFAAPYIDLYLAVSGRAQQALQHIRHVSECQTDGLVRYQLENLLLTHVLVEQLAVLEGGTVRKSAAAKSPWNKAALRTAAAGNRVELLRRIFQGDILSAEKEKIVFQPEDGIRNPLGDAARWLTVRRLVLEQQFERALELCRLVRKDMEEVQHDGQSRSNAFLAFLAIEESLLLHKQQPEQAAALLSRWAGYLSENRLQCPGLTGEEREKLNQLLGGKGEEPAEKDPQPEGEKHHWDSDRVTVECFGPFRVVLPDGQNMSWRTRKAQELFAYLFHLQGGCMDRERLLDTLWPQSAPANATSLLHTTLYSIRKSLAPYGLDGIIRREKRGYQMDMSLVDTARDQVDAICRGESAQVSKLSALYRGSYLEDVEGGWAADSRAWYAGAFLRVCRTTAQRSMDQGDYAAAADFLRGAVSQEPYDEALAGQLIRCYANIGETKNAIAVYRNLKDILERDLQEEPGEEVTKIYKECLLRRLGRGRS